jgi:hypothetical protein
MGLPLGSPGALQCRFLDRGGVSGLNPAVGHGFGLALTGLPRPEERDRAERGQKKKLEA